MIPRCIKIKGCRNCNISKFLSRSKDTWRIPYFNSICILSGCFSCGFSINKYHINPDDLIEMLYELLDNNDKDYSDLCKTTSELQAKDYGITEKDALDEIVKYSKSSGVPIIEHYINKYLLYNFTGIPAVYFPVGKLKDGGSCSFATKKCLSECAAFLNATDDNKIPYDVKNMVMNYILKGNKELITNRILKELRRLNSDMLYWFASGDCPDGEDEQIVSLINRVASKKIIQVGFTRNVKLWEKIDFEDTLRFVLTVDSRDEIKDIGRVGVYAIPDFKTKRVRLYKFINFEEYSYGTCGYKHYETKSRVDHVKKERRKADCRICYKMKDGCFTCLEDDC